MAKSLKWLGLGFVLVMAIAFAVTARLHWFPRPVGTSIIVATTVPPAFDLQCQGADPGDGPQELLMRIDLERGLYCQDDCSVIFPIPRADVRSMLVFKLNAGRHRVETTVSRDDQGRLTYRDFFASNHDYRGACAPAPFSGFPTRIFPGARPSVIPLPEAPQRTLDANWVRQPSLIQRADAYPPWLRLFDVEGSVRIGCATDGRGNLVNCRVISARPANLGLGRAGLRLTNEFQAAPFFWPATPVAPGTPVELTIRFTTSPP